jgi:DNA mismatch endonuclease (patch repair protein)
MDWLTPEQRTRNMSAIRSRGNKSTEKAVRFRMIRAGLRGWKLCADGLPGKPDFVFEEARVVVFLDGCYWHGCPKCYRAPTSNTGYWSEKYKRNKARDRRVGRELRSEGWRVVRIWEHEIEKSPAKVVEKIRALALSQPSARLSATAGTS